MNGATTVADDPFVLFVGELKNVDFAAFGKCGLNLPAERSHLGRTGAEADVDTELAALEAEI